MFVMSVVIQCGYGYGGDRGYFEGEVSISKPPVITAHCLYKHHASVFADSGQSQTTLTDIHYSF